MLPTQGTTQIYSPFGSYVVEQHGAGFVGRGLVTPATAAPPSRAKLEAAGHSVTAAPRPRTAVVLSPEQAAIGRHLQHYYQLLNIGPTSARLDMLLHELERRAEANSRRAA